MNVETAPRSRPQFDEAPKCDEALPGEAPPDPGAAVAKTLLAINTQSADAHSRLANILDGRDDWETSLTHLRRAHELAPAAPQVRLNLALALLRIGNYREGLPLYEARIDKPAWSGFATLASRTTTRQLMLQPGAAVQGKRIVLLAEQGLGDAIMFARYVPMLAQRGARIALACNPTLRAFFARIPGIEHVLSPPADQPLAQINLAALPFDAWLPLASLPHWFGTEPDSIPAAGGFWTPDPARVAAWRSKYNEMGRAGALKVGLVFDCNPAAVNHAARSMRAADLLPLLSLSPESSGHGEGVRLSSVPTAGTPSPVLFRDIDFINLQHGAAGRELMTLAPGVLDPLQSELPLDDYGAALAATDLAITVDTMATHLAGAIGHPAFVAVPRSAQWFWGLTGETTPWYERLRLFRQQKAGDWSGVVAQMISSLRGAKRRSNPDGAAALDCFAPLAMTKQSGAS